MRFDDLAVDERVTYVDDIKESLREEMPYLLFYQIVPMVDITTASTEGSVTDPPSYIESAINPSGGLSPGDAATEAISRSTSGYFDSSTTLVHSGPSIRFSSELERPTRLSFDDDPYSIQSKADDSRRGSTAISEPAAVNSVIPGAPSPAVTPPDESTAARLSRAAAKFAKTGSKSRPTSQAGEGRISLTISRLGFSRPSKEPLNGTGSEIVDEVAIAEEDDGSKEKEHHHHLYAHHKKERTKSKSREKEDKKEKGKQPKEEKTNVPDRECAVM